MMAELVIAEESKNIKDDCHPCEVIVILLRIEKLEATFLKNKIPIKNSSCKLLYLYCYACAKTLKLPLNETNRRTGCTSTPPDILILDSEVSNLMFKTCSSTIGRISHPFQEAYSI